LSMTTKIIWVDSEDRVIGSASRDAVNGIYRVSALWITNNQGKILLARRALSKSHNPGKWGPAVAGTVEEGETYESNILKEAEEELGLKKIHPKKGPKTRTYGEHQFFCQWFTTTVKKPLNQFKIQKAEVEEIKWFSKEELMQQIQEKPSEFLEGITEWMKQFEKT